MFSSISTPKFRQLSILTAVSISTIGAAAGPSDMFQSGRWEITTKTTKFSVPGVLASDPSDGRIETRIECISGAGRAPLTYFSASPPGDKCPPLSGYANAGRFAVEGSCRRQRLGQTRIAVSGTYSQTAYSGNIVARFAYGAQTATVEQMIRGKYVGMCKGNEQSRK